MLHSVSKTHGLESASKRYRDNKSVLSSSSTPKNIVQITGNQHKCQRSCTVQEKRHKEGQRKHMLVRLFAEMPLLSLSHFLYFCYCLLFVLFACLVACLYVCVFLSVRLWELAFFRLAESNTHVNEVAQCKNKYIKKGSASTCPHAC